MKPDAAAAAKVSQYNLIMPRLIVISGYEKRREIDAPTGHHVMQILRDNGYDIEGTCEGALACATCHVVVDSDWYGKLVPVTVDETDMLDFAEGLTATSRLSCQIRMTGDLDGLVVRIPDDVLS